MKVLRIVIPTECAYALRHLGNAVGVTFDDRQVVDVPLRTTEQITGARELEEKFKHQGLSRELRNGTNAVCVYSANVIDLEGC